MSQSVLKTEIFLYICARKKFRESFLLILYHAFGVKGKKFLRCYSSTLCISLVLVQVCHKKVGFPYVYFKNIKK